MTDGIDPGRDIYFLEQVVADLSERAKDDSWRESLVRDGGRLVEAEAKLYDLTILLGLRRAA